MDNTLDYLRESLVNYRENDMMKQITVKLEQNDFKDEEEFVKSLNEEEIAYLDSVVEKELNYARNAQDDVRAEQLREVYELLF
ncbi:MAG TPA: sporulation protein [Lentibacillus sp.]|nr:sporulation protein [Lentibacillus sp.]HLS08701.1 sporulation protein [Lentibacillus sp.]